MERLGVARTGLFNGLIPVASLGGVALVGTGTITPLRLVGALAVLAGVILGLGRARQVPSGTLNQADRGAKPSAGGLATESPARSGPHSYADAA